MYSIFTISRQDVYDYLRCPKIVAIKTHRNLKKPKPDRKKPPERNIRYEVGTIGEVLTQRIFSGKPEDEILSKYADEFDSEESGQESDYVEDEGYSKSEYEIGSIFEREAMPRVKLDLENKGVQLDSNMKEILRTTIAGLGKIKRHLNEEYGQIEIIGHGESRNGILPNKIRPDFVAVSKNQKPILIEVKNTANANEGADNFQASFYNTIVKKFGAIVLEERIESGYKTIVPRTITDTISETVLVYPRQGRAEKITDTISLDQDLIKRIWISKQLGLKGKSPKTDCDTSCAHHKLGELPEDNLEPAIPLALIYSEGLVEQNADLDTTYLRNFLWRRGLGGIINNGLADIRYAEFVARVGGMRDKSKIEKKLQMLSQKKEKFLDDVSERTGFTRQEIDKITSRDTIRSYMKEIKRLEKDMNNELNPWKKLLGKRHFDSLRNTARGQSTKLYPLPKNSTEFVRKSWKIWN